MENKRNFIKRERSNDKKIPVAKEPYRGIQIVSEDTNVNTHKRKDEPVVLMFRDFLFFDVKSYECRNGDLYIRNIVDGVILKRYFRMNANDQLTVFKNRSEFDEFIDKVKEEGYIFGPEVIKKVPTIDPNTGDILSIKSTCSSKIENIIERGSEEFVLNNFSGIRNSETGKIDVITSNWDGVSVTRDEYTDLFDEVVKVLEANVGSAQILNKKDFM